MQRLLSTAECTNVLDVLAHGLPGKGGRPGAATEGTAPTLACEPAASLSWTLASTTLRTCTCTATCSTASKGCPPRGLRRCQLVDGAARTVQIVAESTSVRTASGLACTTVEGRTRPG
jgi:hypothetical protein